MKININDKPLVITAFNELGRASIHYNGVDAGTVKRTQRPVGPDHSYRTTSYEVRYAAHVIASNFVLEMPPERDNQRGTFTRRRRRKAGGLYSRLTSRIKNDIKELVEEGEL